MHLPGGRALLGLATFHSWRPIRASAGVLLGILTAAASTGAQQVGSITGLVRDASTNEPIAAAQVSVTGTGLGVVTTEGGRFLVLNVPAGTHELVAQRIGYRTERRQVSVNAGDATVVNFQLAQTAIELEEVIVTGTAGAASRRELGNSVGTISKRAIEAAPAQSVTQLLNGQTTGISVFQSEGQVGSGSRILLRGMSSVTQSNEPLIYVDGVRYTNNAGVAGNNDMRNPGPDGAQTSPHPLNDLNPDDIERVEVIRGSAATTMYGTEASGGVIQIFTKRGRTGQAASWTISAVTGANFVTGNNLGPVIGKMDDWLFMKPWMKTGPMGNVNLSVAGGTQLLQYFFSGGYSNENGVVDKNWSKRYSIRGNFGFAPSQSFRVDFTTAYANRANSYVESGDNTWGLMLNVLRGTQDYTNAAVNRATFQGDPDQLLFDISNTANNEHFVGGATFTYSASPSLSSGLTVGLDYTNASNEETAPFDFVLYPQGWRSVNTFERRIITLDYNTSWSHDIGESLSSRFALGGQLFNDFSHTVYATSESFGGPGPKTIRSGSTRRSDETLLKVVTAGFFAQEVLGIKDRLFLTGGLRVDGNSAFGTDLGLQVYPKVSASYVISDHDFWPEWWQVMKLRGAYGESGKAPGAFDAVRTWDPVSGYEGQPGVTPANLGNAELGPERTGELEVGFEGSVLDDRLGVDFSYFRSTTSDALLPVTEPPSSGFLNAQLRNVGTLRNSGFDLSISGVPINTSSLRWDITGRFSTNNSEVVDLGGAPSFFLGWGSALGQWVREGYPIVAFFGDKVMNPDEKAAPVIELDQYYGPVYPTRTVSFSTSLNIGQRLTLYALGEYQGGMYEFYIMPWQEVRRGLWPECNDREPIAEAEAIWRARCQKPTPNFDFWTRPSDFFKLRTVSLMYVLPDNLVPGTRNASATLSGGNLWKWTKGVGLDPELNTGTGQTYPARYQYYQMPPTSMITLTLRASF